jgi:hypothetical protein
MASSTFVMLCSSGNHHMEIKLKIKYSCCRKSFASQHEQAKVLELDI